MALYSLAVMSPQGVLWYVECNGDSWGIVPGAREATKFSSPADAVLAAECLPDFPLDFSDPLAPARGRIVQVAEGHTFEETGAGVVTDSPNGEVNHV